MPTSPNSLYDLTVATVCQNCQCFKQYFRTIPETILFDIYITLYKQGKICILCLEFSDLDLFSKMLKLTKNRVLVIKSFQALMHREANIAKDLVRSYKDKCRKQPLSSDPQLDSNIDLGLKLGGFLSDASWYLESCDVLETCRDLCLASPENSSTLRKTLYCCHKLLHAQVIYSKFEKASETKRLAESIIQKLTERKEKMCLSGIHTQFSFYSYSMGHYDEGYNWSVKSIQELNQCSNPRLVIEALTQASKACVVKRKISKAKNLCKIAVYLSSEIFGTDHPKYAETLLDYGFYLLHSDAMKDGVTVYKKALKLKEEIFGSMSLEVAIAHEDLAYAFYVHEYCSGQFINAKYHADQAISIMTVLLPEEHLMLASAERVKALILEEIALDHLTPSNWLSLNENMILCEAEKLHKNALKLSLTSFGEENIHVAKHYGNLGRLYQSMTKYKMAETMQLKSIEIKEKILGQDDYEVGLSIGHLASLYNYHMGEHRKAEALYIRSLNISLKLFSHSYSGLEYDYRGLIYAYEKLGESDNASLYTRLLGRWKELREEHSRIQTAPLNVSDVPCSLESIKSLFSDEQSIMDAERC